MTDKRPFVLLCVSPARIREEPPPLELEVEVK